MSDLRFSGFTPNRAEDRKPTGKIPVGNSVEITVAVPDNARMLTIMVEQILSDAELALRFGKKTLHDTQGVHFSVFNPSAGEYSAQLSADREVTDCNVTVTVQVRHGDHKTG